MGGELVVTVARWKDRVLGGGGIVGGSPVSFIHGVVSQNRLHTIALNCVIDHCTQSLNTGFLELIDAH